MSPSSSRADAAEKDRQSLPPIILGDEAQRLIACNIKLQELGIDDTIKLPRIVVIGDQSTGKSSLIEAISSIKVPKATSLCTKCPIAINLTGGKTSSAPWSCTVLIEEKFTYNHSLRKKTVSKATPLGPWQPRQDMKLTQVQVIEDPEQLLAAIGVAEKIVLNPQHSIGNATTSADTFEMFSPNTIRLDISRGNCPNLSFVDLPGVIQTAGRDQPDYYVEVVASLTKQYATDENNIIILTLPVNHDVACSRSYSIIQKQNAQDRTLAVFTKADLAQEAERQNCLHTYFSEESEEEFEYGNHMVMLNSSAAPQETEDEYFAKEPYASLPASVREHLGINNLIPLLRRILFEKTAQTLPTNLEKIEARMAQVKEQLDSMPEPPDAMELPYQLREQMHLFESKVKQVFSSTVQGEANLSRSKMLRHMQDFSNRVEAGRPTMFIRTEVETQKQDKAEHALREGSNADPVLIDDDSSCAEPPPAEIARLMPKQLPQKNVTPESRVRRFRLEEVREINHQHYKLSVPGGIEPGALEDMYCMSVQYWDQTFQEFMQKISRGIHQEFLHCILTNFGHQKHLALYNQLLALTKQHLDTVIQEEWSFLDRICEAERRNPFTLNTNAMQQAELQSLAQRREKRADARLELERMLHKASTANKKKKGKEPTLEDIGPDSWDVEVQMTAKTRAYYDVASHRFVDTICQQIFARLIPRCQEGLVPYIKDRLGLNEIPRHRQAIIFLMSEDSEREALRIRLNDEMDRLNEGHAFIAHALGFTATARRLFSAPITPNPSIYADAVGDPRSDTSPVVTPNKRKATDGENGVSDGSPTKRHALSQASKSKAAFIDHDGQQHQLVDRSRSMDLE